MEKIKTVEQVYYLALQRKSVCFYGGRSIPAAFVLNYQAGLLLRVIREGKLFVYQPARRSRWWLKKEGQA